MGARSILDQWHGILVAGAADRIWCDVIVLSIVASIAEQPDLSATELRYSLECFAD